MSEKSFKKALKPLRLSYELAWRTEQDQKFLKSVEWKRLRKVILERDNHTCNYCGYQRSTNMQINHIDGNPKNNDHDNLEVICQMCHMVTHSGFWCVVKRVMDCYSKSRVNQNEIVQITRKMREEGHPDDEITRFLGLEGPVPWQQNLEYLSKLYGFITSRPIRSQDSKPLLSEEEQQESLRNRENW